MEAAGYSTLLVTVSVYVVICSRRLGSSYMYNVVCYMYIVLHKENEMIYYIICYSLIFGVSMLACFLQDVIYYGSFFLVLYKLSPDTPSLSICTVAIIRVGSLILL